MKRNKLILTQAVTLTKKIKVQLDHKTMIIINHLSALDVWKERYPNAKIIS
jgi:hypothetical protein